MDIEEFKREVLPVKNKLYRFALRMLNSTVEAEDIVQDVFLKLWSAKDKLDEYRSIEAFAVVMTRNLCLDRLKSPKRKTNEIIEPDIKFSDNTADKKLEMKESVTYIKKIIDQLPLLQRTIIHLRDIEGYEFEEITQVTKLSLNAVRVNLSRARKTVREELVKNRSYEYSSY
jgi:RNA polymerase sigma-70 factor, ECF subfamily